MVVERGLSYERFLSPPASTHLPRVSRRVFQVQKPRSQGPNAVTPPPSAHASQRAHSPEVLF